MRLSVLCVLLSATSVTFAQRNPSGISEQMPYVVKAVNFNTPGMEFSPVLYLDGIVFVSSRPRKGSAGTETEGFLNLFYTRESEDGTFSEPEVFEPKILSPYHEGPVVFFDKGNKKILTRNSATRKNKLKDGSVNPLELVYSERIGSEKWTEPMPLPFAGTNYSVAHPAISSDGTTLYFSSNMPGTLGESDLFVSHFKNGTWSAPRNMGAKINTPGQELFPFLYNDSILYFSSNGRGGLGGLDLFYCVVKDDPSIIHLEAPLNSEGDDFGFYLERGGVSGFFSSNRPGGAGADDIYYFEEIQRFVQIQVSDSLTGNPIRNAVLTVRHANKVIGQTVSDLMGEVQFRLRLSRDYRISITADGYQSRQYPFGQGVWPVDEDTPLKFSLKPLKPALAGPSPVTISPSGRRNLTNVITFDSRPLDADLAADTREDPMVEASGEPIDTVASPLLKLIVVEVVNGIPAVIVAKNDTIHEFTMATDTRLTNSDLNLSFEIPRGAQRHHYEDIIREQTVSQGYGVSDFLLIRRFFFDSGKTWVRNDASAQLDKIIEIMHAYPQFKLEMTFHADSRGTDDFNLDLSKARAVEVTAYLTQSGIIKDRIHSSFVGESRLLMDCGDLSDCDELLHQINRTVEFKFITR